MSVYRLDFQARDSSQTLSCSFERNSWNTGSFGVETVHQWDLDAHLLFTFKELAEMCPLAPSSSWVSFRWSSFPVTPGGQSLRAKLPNMWAPSVSSAGSSASFSVFWFHFMWLPSGTTQATQRIEIMATVICACCPKATDAKPCTKNTEAELRIKDTFKADWAPL